MDEEYYSYIKELFDKHARFYDITEIVLSGVRTKVANFANTRERARVLDVCTGTGRQAFAFAKKGYEVIGIDFSEGMLRIANKNNKYDNLKFKVSDATNIPFENNYFDVSCISFALHDMPLNIREKVLQEMVRVTILGGIIVVVDYSLPKNKINRWLIYHFAKSYESKYYPEFIKFDYRELLEKAGIEIREELSILLGAGKILKGIKAA